MFRSLKIYSSARVSKQQSACAETFSLLLFYKNIVFFVGTSSWSFWDFERKSLVFDGKCLGSVLKNDFYLIRETFWLKCFEMIFEYKVCLLSLSERLSDTQQDFFCECFQNCILFVKKNNLEVFCKTLNTKFFRTSSDNFFRVWAKVSSTVLKTAIFVRWGTIWIFQDKLWWFFGLREERFGSMSETFEKLFPNRHSTYAEFNFRFLFSSMVFEFEANFLSDFDERFSVVLSKLLFTSSDKHFWRIVLRKKQWI